MSVVKLRASASSASEPVSRATRFSMRERKKSATIETTNSPATHHVTSNGSPP
jgi:hypothetical protein